MSEPEETGTLVPVWFISPEGFTSVPLVESIDTRVARYVDVLDAFYPEVEPVAKLALARMNELHMQQVLRQGAIYMASFLYTLGDGSVCGGLVSAFMVDGPVSGGARFPERVITEAGQRFAGEEVDAGVVTVPAGRAALITRDVPSPSVASQISPSRGEEWEVHRQLEVYLLFPDGSAHLRVVMSTADLHAWKELLPIFAGFISGISFSPPSVASGEKSSESRAAAIEDIRRDFG